MSERYTLQKEDALPADLALLLAQMIEVRSKLLGIIDTITEETLDFTPSDRKIETIGTLLLHIAAVEWSWILEDIYEKEFDYEKWKHAFPLRSTVNLPQLKKQGKKFYLKKLSKVRDKAFEKLSEEKNLSRIVTIKNNEYSIEWILFHLIEHESIHIGQINFLIRLFNLSKR